MEMGLHDLHAIDATDVETALRPLGWSELCARLVAAQDYRRSLAGLDVPQMGGRVAHRLRTGQGSDTQPGITSGGAPGSFHGGTARMLEHFDTGNRIVNSNSSTSGKGNQGKPVDSRQPSLSAFAERQADENRHD